MEPTFMSFSFGCRVNEAEKQQIDTKLLQTGFLWDEVHPAFYIINTCAVTGKAEREVRQHIYQIRKKFPHTVIIATGCSATAWMQHKTTIDTVNHWIANTDKESIPALLERLTKGTEKNIKKNDDHDKFLHSGRLVVKIQDGCNRFCSYCIVPYTRGRAVSRTITDVVRDIRVSPVPVQEVILTAINTEYFGVGTGETLTQLLDAILEQTDVPRISFGSIHPWSITDEFIAWYKRHADNPRFVHFFHIPIQSGSDRILHLMNRQYTTQALSDRLTQLHVINPHALLATDVIVGYPGEGKREWEETYEFLRKSPLTRFHVFRYSPRSGTAAERSGKTESIIPTPKQKRERAKQLAELSTEKYRVFLETHIGKPYTALMLDPDGKTRNGLLDNQIPVRVRIRQPIQGTCCTVMIRRSEKGVLIGET